MNDTAILPEIQDLLDEVADKNHVVVAKFSAREKHGKLHYTQVSSELAKTVAMAPSLVRQDKLRMIAGLKPLYLPEMYRRFGGDLQSVTKNLRTTIGINYVAGQLAGTDAGNTAIADWIALSNNNGGAAVGHSSSTVPWSSNQSADAAAGASTGEYTALGVARKLAVMAHTAAATSYTASATWTASGTVTALQLAGLFGGTSKTAFNASTALNILFLENTFTATSLVLNDQISLTWTVNI